MHEEDEEDDEMSVKRRVGTLTNEELGVHSEIAIVRSLHKLISKSEYYSLVNFVADQSIWHCTLQEVKEQLIHSIEND